MTSISGSRHTEFVCTQMHIAVFISGALCALGDVCLGMTADSRGCSMGHTSTPLGISAPTATAFKTIISLVPRPTIPTMKEAANAYHVRFAWVVTKYVGSTFVYD